VLRQLSQQEETLVMLNNRLRNAVALGLAGLVALAGCAAQPSEDVGSLSIQLSLPSGEEIDTVTYTLSGGMPALAPPIVGTIQVTSLDATVSALVGALPVGTGYVIDITATDTTGDTTCDATDTFDILPNMTTTVTLSLQCFTSDTDGNLVIAGTFNQCPEITLLQAMPLQVTAGDPIELSSTAQDQDPSDTITFAWTATFGGFADDTMADTTYDCAVAGAQTLTLTVDDGECQDTLDVDVTCVPAGICGNGIEESGEVCDDGNTVSCDGCTALCQREDDICGDSIVECGEGCDDGNTMAGDGCNAVCASEGCGNGTLDAGEVCDDGNILNCDGCNATCSRADDMCGDSIVECGEQCDGVLDPPQGCSSCTIVDICQPCVATAGNCFGQPATNFYNACFNNTVDQMGNSGMLCAALIACIQEQTTNAPPSQPQGTCVNPAGGDIQACYCGYTADDGSTPKDAGSCAATGPGFDAPCVPEVQAAAGDGATPQTDPMQIASLFVNNAFALGDASQFSQCVDSALGSDCTQECAFQP
jgi:cysteine-rich repeat protein